MKSDYLKDITPEQRAQMQEKARIARDKKKEAGKNLRQDFSDEKFWRQTASDLGFRLPMSYVPASETKHLKRAMKKLGVDPKEWLEAEGFSRLTTFGNENPDWPAWAHVGLLLEWYVNK
jgi:hypothetical protein